MSEVRTNSITDAAGTGAPNFPNGLEVGGVLQKAFLGNAQFLTTDTTLTSADDKDLLVCSPDITVTLPAVSEGLVFGFVNASDNLLVIATPNPATTVGRSAGGVLLLARQEAIVVCDGVGWQMIGADDAILLQTVQFAASGTYVPSVQAKMFLACATGATGGTRATANAAKGASGGAGYSEKLYTAPFAASYAVTVGAGGAVASTGGTTTFDTISIPSSIGNTITTGTAGAAGTGGSFNATGGSGGAGNSTFGGGGGGGSATRAGNGGNGSAGTSGAYGAGGGTGGNNAVGTTPGAAATAVSGSAYSLTAFANAVTFRAGGSLYVVPGTLHYGAFSLNQYSGFGTTFDIGSVASGGGAYGNSYAGTTGISGLPGHVTIVEIF
jgi:hypothetical protein